MLPPNVADRAAFGRSFDLSNFPNLRELSFGVFWEKGDLPWIPIAFTTLGPTTSPHLSVIRLQFLCGRPTKTLIKDAGGDLQRIADEVARIEREFGEALDIFVYRDPPFKTVLDTLNVSLVVVDCTRWSHQLCPTDPSGLSRMLKWERIRCDPSHFSLPIHLVMYDLRPQRFIYVWYSSVHGKL